MKARICKNCGSNKYYCKRLCKSCYTKQLIPQGWSKKRDNCQKCGTSDHPHIAHGLCESCYSIEDSTILCACGCGETVTIYRGKVNKFRKGHWLKAQGANSEFQKRHKEAFTGKNNPCYGKFGKDHPAYGHYTSPKVKEQRKLRRIRSLNEKLTKTTDIELILSNILDELNINHRPQEIINDKFCVDEFIEDHNLIIEAFGGYWHGDPRLFAENEFDKIQRTNFIKDKSRMKYLKTCGYKLLILWGKDLKERPDWCKDQISYIIKN